MPDIYAEMARQPVDVQEMLANALMVRAQEPQMVAMRRRYLGWLDIPDGGRGIEIGCGAGDVVADLLESTPLAEAVGLDPGATLIDLARERFGSTAGLSFVEGDARATEFEDGSFDLVVFHTTLCHVPGADTALAETFRILRPDGQLAIFDGDYATITVAVGPNDPVQTCVEHAASHLVNDPWLCRSLARRIADAGFEVERTDAHPYMAEAPAAYFMTLVNRGADFLAADGLIGAEGAAALKAEAQARIDEGRFFGFISFNSVIARKPA